MEKIFTKSIIVKADVKDVYNAWSSFENFPRFMKNIKSVRKTGDNSSHWKIKGPLGVKVEWVAQTTVLDPDRRIGWSTKDNADGNLTTSGQVTFLTLPKNETEVVAVVHYVTRAGFPGEVLARLFGNQEKSLEQNLRSFKQYIEGESIHTP